MKHLTMADGGPTPVKPQPDQAKKPVPKKK